MNTFGWVLVAALVSVVTGVMIGKSGEKFVDKKLERKIAQIKQIVLEKT